MDSYRVLLFLHVGAAVLAFGSTVAYPFLQMAADKQGVRGARFFLGFTKRVSRAFQYPAFAILLLAGIGLIFDDRTGYSDDMPGWLLIGAGLFGAIVAFEVFLQAPILKRANAVIDGAGDDEPLPPEYVQLGKLMGVIGTAQSVMAIAVLFLMAWKPGA